MPTQAEIQERLNLYLAAERSILAGSQSYSIGGDQFTKADLPAIQRQIRELQQQLSMASGSGFRTEQVVFG